ncbi:hypothetical protein [Synechococcus sp. UW140]|uniref:hypothetical protein n=1 Tax=Synechococcus sp. UW140 TaxID=368503 RepID=UPI0031379316
MRYPSTERSITANHPLWQATANAQEGGAEGFSGDRASGEHGSCVTAASVPRYVQMLQLLAKKKSPR